MLLRGEKYRLGQFDRDGNFIPYAHVVRMNGRPLINGSLNAQPVNETGGSIVYEHRSGRLIRGMLSREPRGVFVPEIGSAVIDLKKDFDPRKTDRVIYNHPEFLFCTARKPVPEPPKAGLPAGWKLVPFREAFPHTSEDQNPWFARVIGEMMELGHLSGEGEFIPDYGLPVFPYVKVKVEDRTRDVLQDGGPRPFYYTLPRPAWLSGPKQPGQKEDDPEEVYEYRSGRLIKGTLQGTGNFVPELGSTVLDFKDYNPNSRRRIYNLPGVLRKIK